MTPPPSLYGVAAPFETRGVRLVERRELSLSVRGLSLRLLLSLSARLLIRGRGLPLLAPLPRAAGDGAHRGAGRRALARVITGDLSDHGTGRSAARGAAHALTSLGRRSGGRRRHRRRL